ncbi:MAG: hypothetical protein Hals2KO_09310 [Halioglobus sp.]
MSEKAVESVAEDVAEQAGERAAAGGSTAERPAEHVAPEPGAEAAGDGPPQSVAEAVQRMSSGQRAKFRLTKLAGVHALVWLIARGLFAAADSWRMLSDLSLASLLAVVTGVLAGIVTANVLHEWGHYLGARRSGGAFEIPEKLGLFVYDWDFKQNSVAQFLTMSRAGTIGGALALLLGWWLVPTDTLARAALLAGLLGSFAFAARIEWPVLRRVGEGGDPLTELSKIDEGVLKNATLVATGVGLVALWFLSP